MHRLLPLLVLLTTVAAPLVPLDCPLFAGSGDAVAAEVHGHGGGTAGAMPMEPHDHHSTPPGHAPDTGSHADHGSSHHGDTGCRAGSMCGGVGVLAAGVIGSPDLVPSHAPASAPSAGWPTAWPGHDTPPPRLLV